MIRIWMPVLLLFTVTTSSPTHSADRRAERNEPAAEHPLALVAFTSLDRVHLRLTTVVEAMMNEGSAEKLLAQLFNDEDGEDDDVSGINKVLHSPGLDRTRPIGVMCFPHWFSGDDALIENPIGDFSSGEDFEDLLSLVVLGANVIFYENATAVLCIPYQDRDLLLAAVKEGLEESGDSLQEDPDLPGWYKLEDDEELRVGFAHRYLLIAIDSNEQKRFDWKYPDFASLARGSLGKNDVVYALYRKGLPAVVRDVMAPAFQMSFAARFQREDHEPEIDFRLRTMSSSLQTQLLDLALSHVEEFRIAGRLDSATRAIHIEPEVIGTKGGKLAKFFNDGKRLKSPFSNQPTDDAVFASTMSLPLPTKDWKPTVDALYAFAQSLGNTSSADVARAFAKTIESGQFDIYAYNPSWNQGLIAIRLNGGAAFPGQFQASFKELADFAKFEVAVDEVDGVPIDRKPTTLVAFPAASILMMPFVSLFGGEFSFPELNTGVGYETTEEIVDGQKTVVSKIARTNKGPAKNCLWLAATPQAVWLGFGPAQSECPEWFKTQIAASLTAPASLRNTPPFQLTFRGLGTTPEPEIQQVAHQQADDAGRPTPQGSFMVSAPPSPQVLQRQAEQSKAREALLEGLPDAIHCDFRATETGAKLSITIEEAYFQLLAALLRDSIEIEQLSKRYPPRAMEHVPIPSR